VSCNPAPLLHCTTIANPGRISVGNVSETAFDSNRTEQTIVPILGQLASAPSRSRRGNLAAQQGQSDLRAETTRDKKRKPGSSARPVRPPSGDNARQQRRLLPKTIKAEQQPAAAHCYTRIFHRFSPQIQADSVDLRLGFPIRLPWLRRTPSAGGSASSWRSRPSTPPSSPPTRAGSRTPRPPPLQGGGRRVPLRRP
jgi:hypothetical protein